MCNKEVHLLVIRISVLSKYTVQQQKLKNKVVSCCRRGEGEGHLTRLSTDSVWEKVTAAIGSRQTPRYETKSKICLVGHFRHLVTEKVKNVSNNIPMLFTKRQ